METSKKRKRAKEGIINPLSHAPNTLRQFTLAGYPHESPLPSQLYPGFPHRPPPNPRRLGLNNRPLSVSGVSDHTKSGDEGDDEIDLTEQETTDFDDNLGQTTAEEATDYDTSASSTSSRKKKRGGLNDGEDGTRKDRKAHEYHSQVGILVNTIRRCLTENDIPTAKRAFGLLVRAKVAGKKVDLRYERMWEMGAEIIMRKGEPVPLHSASTSSSLQQNPPPQEETERQTEFEQALAASENPGKDEQASEEEEEEETPDARLQREERNLASLKSYYEYLIQQHPFSKAHPQSTARSILDFHCALFSAEIEGCYKAHKRGLERIEETPEDEFLDHDDSHDDRLMDIDEEPSHWNDSNYDHEGLLINSSPTTKAEAKKSARIREEKNEVRLAALRRLVEIAERMDSLMEANLFARDHELLRLRAMVALYMGDLQVPPEPRTAEEDRTAKRTRDRQRQKARELLENIKSRGGRLKEYDEELLLDLEEEEYDSDGEGEGDGGEDEEGSGEETVLQMYSSLP
ncbi:RNA polymerase I-specific transcription initiation factor rrn11 [Podospora australis]|uniref:RNA polymerase I-specific transcription initiation factor rrn11 n=1 Tax=Podospora australis TaxID=1536484 RepID=A0AAN6X646_9PEZI|nr:RNA polymerase I-specific transcription initiation factor rrn11 [Podospora australis]